MPMGYGIQNIGSYVNDPYFMQAFSVYNPNFRMAQGNQATQQQNTDQTSTSQPEVNPTFKGSENKEESHTGRNIFLGLTAIAGTAASIYAYSRGKKVGGNGFIDSIKKGVHEIFKNNKTTNKVNSSLNNIINKGGKDNVTQVVNINGNTCYINPQGKIEKIIKADRAQVSDIADFLTKNEAIKDELGKMTLNGNNLPDGVKLISAGREITHNGDTFKMFYDKNGKVERILKKNQENNFEAISDLEKFIADAKNKDLLDAGRTFEETLQNKTFKIVENGRTVDLTNDIVVKVKDGKLIDATFQYNGNITHFKSDELQELQKSLASDIKEIGTLNHGIKPEDCIFEYVTPLSNGNSKTVVRFNGNQITDPSNITQINYTKQTTATDIQQTLDEANNGIKKAIDGYTSTGVLPKDATLEQVFYRNPQTGNSFKIVGDKIENVRLAQTSGSYGANQSIKGNELTGWLETQANKNEYESILDLMK